MCRYLQEALHWAWNDRQSPSVVVLYPRPRRPHRRLQPAADPDGEVVLVGHAVGAVEDGAGFYAGEVGGVVGAVAAEDEEDLAVAVAALASFATLPRGRRSG